MTVARLAISFDEKLEREVRRAAGSEPISTWLADAARRKLRAQGLTSVISDWEKAHGAIDDDELRAAASERRKGRRRH